MNIRCILYIIHLFLILFTQDAFSFLFIQKGSDNNNSNDNNSHFWCNIYITVNLLVFKAILKCSHRSFIFTHASRFSLSTIPLILARGTPNSCAVMPFNKLNLEAMVSDWLDDGSAKSLIYNQEKIILQWNWNNGFFLPLLS